MINFKKSSIMLRLGLFILTVSTVMLFLSACAVTADSGRNHGREPYPGRGGLRSIEGQWYVINAGNPGKIEFYWDRHRWAGRIWIDYYSKWEDLTDILFDPRTGELQFNRPAFRAPYSGTLSGNRIVGTFIYQGGNYSWEARRP